MHRSFLSPQSISQVPGYPKDWFAVRRNFYVRRAFEEYFLLQQDFQELYLVFLSNPSLFQIEPVNWHLQTSRKELYQRIQYIVGSETDKGTLWQLKDLCHRIWPQVGEYGEEEGFRVDWLIGSLFHEAMKFKENVYILTEYIDVVHSGRHSQHLGRGRMPNDDNSTGNLVESAGDIRGLLTRISGETGKHFDVMLSLCGRISYTLRLAVPSLTGNALVIRLLMELEEEVRNIWGESVEDIFNGIFPDSCEEGFCIAGRSYFEGQWYHRALSAYRRALLVNGNCHEAIIKTCHLEAILQEKTTGTVPVR